MFLHLLAESLRRQPGETVGRFVVVAVLRCAIDQHLAQRLIPLEVGIERRQQFIYRGAAPVLMENERVERRQRVSHRGSTHTLYAGEVVARTAPGQIKPAFQTVAGGGRDEGLGFEVSVYFGQHVQRLHHQPHQVGHLPTIGFDDVFNAGELAGVTGGQAELIGEEPPAAVVERQFQAQPQVEERRVG